LSAPLVIVIGSNAAIRVRAGALEIEHGPRDDKRTIRLDVDTAPKPHTILFDGHGEFLTGDALRWCARYRISLILSDGPGRIATFIHAALEADAGAAVIPDTNPGVIRAQCAANAVGIARDIVRAKIEAEIASIERRSPFDGNAARKWIDKLDSADTVAQLIIIEAQAAMCYWRAFKDMGLRECKGGNLPRSWLRFANRNKGAQFLGNKNALHPVNAMLNYAYVVEAGRLAKALAARGLALSIGFLHSDKHGRNSLVWDAIEPVRPSIDKRVFSYIASREFARADFPQTGISTFRLSRDIISTMLSRVCLSAQETADAADAMLRLIERHTPDNRTLYRPDMRRRKA
jgi:CRISP-associated protein Cas1